MKNLPIILFLVFIGCNPKEDKPVVVTPPKVDTVDTTHLPDVVLENPEMDRYSTSENARRKFPPKPRPGDPPLPPPVPSNGCLLLDFNGQIVSNTLWNTNGTFTCAPSGLNVTSEQTVFDRAVSYHAVFSPYIMITRDETVFNSYPQNKRRRIIITTSTPFGGGMGGIAYLNSFSWFDDTPAFVFSSLLSFNIKNISDAASHEGGHSLGLRHQSDWKDGVKISEYLWGELIMGASYNYPSPHWGVGLNSLGIEQNDTSIVFETLRK